MNINILTFNNQVGIVTDAYLLKNLLSQKYNVTIQFLNDPHSLQKSDIGIWIQNVYITELSKFKINIFYINEEWFDYPTEILSQFDYIICKSKYAKDAFFSNLTNIHHIPFISTNNYNPLFSNKKNTLLHFMGKSLQKNTEAIIASNLKFTLHDPSNRFSNLPHYINHKKEYLSEIKKEIVLNAHNIHICCSLYESWGHYLFEGLSTGANIICSDIPVFKEMLDENLIHFLPTKKSTNLAYTYCNTTIYPYREAHFINESDLKNVIDNFSEKGSNFQRRDLYRSIMESSKTKILEFFKNI